MSERIDHAAEVTICINYARETESANEAHLSMLQAQVHATLALVEQQRIANLLEAGEARVEKLDPWDFGSDLADLKPEIREALGL